MRVIIIFLLCIASFCFIACDDSNKASLVRAGIMSEDIVKEKMRYPSEVEFKDEYLGEEISPTQFKVLRRFTAKNAFGVKSDYAYRIYMTFKGEDWAVLNNWEYEDLTIENVATGEQNFYHVRKNFNQSVVDSLTKVITGK